MNVDPDDPNSGPIAWALAQERIESTRAPEEDYVSVVDGVMSDNTSLRARVAELEIRLAAARSARATAESKLEGLRKVEQTGRVIIDELAAENAALCRANTEERARRKAAERERDGVMADCNNLSIDLDAARATVERVRECAEYLRFSSNVGDVTVRECVLSIEDALTPPGDGGGPGPDDNETTTKETR